MVRPRGPGRDMSYEGDVIARHEKGETFAEIARATGRSKARAHQVWARHVAEMERFRADVKAIDTELDAVPDCWVCGCPLTNEHRCTGVQ